MPIFKPDEFLLNILPKKRLLGIDHGTKTLGIAISNSDMTVASPIKTIKRDKLKSDLSKLISIFDKTSSNKATLSNEELNEGGFELSAGEYIISFVSSKN